MAAREGEGEREGEREKELKGVECAFIRAAIAGTLSKTAKTIKCIVLGGLKSRRIKDHPRIKVLRVKPGTRTKLRSDG